MMTKIALTIPTGRPRVKAVVEAFIENAKKHNYNPKDFSIYLSIDTEFQDSDVEDFHLDSAVEFAVKKVEYITKQDRSKIADELTKYSPERKEIINHLFRGNGYSKQRNAALILAMKDGNDIAICIDDDESPYIPIKKKNGSVFWRDFDFFGPHIKELTTGTDITRGPYMGYQSPIPSDFEKDVPEEIRIKLGEALQLGSDVITRYSFFNLMNQIKYLTEEDLETEKKSFIVESGIHGKHIYAGNMGINLHSVRQGRIPIFFTPPNARGEDTIFALQLEHLIVKEVPSYIFHDPFEMYPEIFQNKFPDYLRAIPVTSATKARFTNALIGWLKYAPILITMTSKTSEEGKERMETMLKKIKEPTVQLAQIFNTEDLNTCFTVLEEYANKSIEHYQYLLEAQSTWRDSVIPQISLNPVSSGKT